MSWQVLRDGQLRDRDSELEELRRESVERLRWVRPVHLNDELSDLGGDRRPAWPLRSALPAPVEAEALATVGSQIWSSARRLSFLLRHQTVQPLMVFQIGAENQSRARPGHRAESRTPCELCSTSRCCFFAVCRPSSEVGGSRRSWSLHCASSSGPRLASDRGPGSQRSIAASGLRCPASGLPGRRPW